MASGETDMNGYFTLEGHTAEFFTIDPKLNIYHRCGSQEKKNFLKKILMIKKICPKKLTFWVPKEYVSRGKHAARTYEFGTLEMSLKYKHSKTDCFH
ncbi:unnamed protein product [Anisakis simplex]|uniref:Transthyretin-like family protein n=1 Tax=Anisakis simplex TaxID=6269 RepID=A0A0M3JFA6_ANISI|nr:unnamed protein product [Anisakis simplex]